MRREGSALQGLGVVFLKELNDHLTSARMLVLQLLVLAVPLVSLYSAIDQLKQSTAEDPFLYLRILTVAGDQLPSFVSFLGFLIPLMSIGLAFDSINGEHNRRTLSRILAQPIYRDALLFGKFLAGLATLTISLVALWLLVIGSALCALGIPPGAEEIARSLVFLVVSIAYAGVWLALALLFSIVFRTPATAALVSLGLWLFLALMWPVISSVLANIIAPPDPRYAAIGLPTPETFELQQMLARLSPGVLYSEVMQVVLNPAVRGLGLVGQLFLPQGAVPNAPVPFAESMMIAWPQIVGLVAGTIMLFVIGYIVFQRQEVRA
jgi:ABC-2 type transport system permease protein